MPRPVTRSPSSRTQPKSHSVALDSVSQTDSKAAILMGCSAATWVACQWPRKGIAMAVTSPRASPVVIHERARCTWRPLSRYQAAMAAMAKPPMTQVATMVCARRGRVDGLKTAAHGSPNPQAGSDGARVTIQR